MSRLRIVCKAPPPPQQDGPIRFWLSPSWMDVDLFVVNDDGSETPLTNVSAITWSCRQGEEPTATLEFLDVDVEAEAEVPT